LVVDVGDGDGGRRGEDIGVEGGFDVGVFDFGGGAQIVGLADVVRRLGSSGSAAGRREQRRGQNGENPPQSTYHRLVLTRSPAPANGRTVPPSLRPADHPASPLPERREEISALPSVHVAVQSPTHLLQRRTVAPVPESGPPGATSLLLPS